jgi:hypothetical protein
MAAECVDLTYLMEVRDRAFHVRVAYVAHLFAGSRLRQLLLRRSGGATPLVHAMRLGKSHQEVAVILLGALSRWVNQLGERKLHMISY